MKDEVETSPTTIGHGLFTIPNSTRPISKKVYDLFTKLKKRAKDADATSSNPGW